MRTTILLEKKMEEDVEYRYLLQRTMQKGQKAIAAGSAKDV
jgi:hypothetical protein